MEIKKVFKSRKGFTLVELLAVIVVLAIIMLLAVQAVFPQMVKARKNAFAIEANSAIDAAQSYYMTAALTDGVSIGTSLCLDIDFLIDQNQYDADKDKYEGWVTIKPNGDEDGDNGYLYTVSLTNQQYYVSEAGVKSNSNVNITADDVKEGKLPVTPSKPSDCKKSS